MDVISEESPEFIKESAKITFNMTFDDIDISDRILLFKVERDEHEIMKIQNKVERAREFLQDIENKSKIRKLYFTFSLDLLYSTKCKKN